MRAAGGGGVKMTMKNDISTKILDKMTIFNQYVKTADIWHVYSTEEISPGQY